MSTDKGALREIGRRSRFSRAFHATWLCLGLALAIAPLLPSPAIAASLALVPLTLAIGACRSRDQARFVVDATGLSRWSGRHRVQIDWREIQGPVRTTRALGIAYLSCRRSDAPDLLLCVHGLDPEERDFLRTRLEAAASHNDVDPGRGADEALDGREAPSRSSAYEAALDACAPLGLPRRRAPQNSELEATTP